MSTMTPSQKGLERTMNLHQLGPPKLKNDFATFDCPPDPLLDSGSFMITHPSTTSFDQTLNKKEQIKDQQLVLPPDPLLDYGSYIVACPSAFTKTTIGQIRYQQSATLARSNGATELVTTPQKLPQRRSAATKSATAAKKNRQRQSAAAESSSWLPPNWTVEERVRNSGATAGMIDKFYYEPVSGRQFRSKNEVLYFLIYGTPPKRKRQNP